MAQQTAVDWLYTRLKSGVYTLDELYESAKETEKKQIIKTANDVDNSDFWVKYESFEQYYNETYENK